MEEPSNVSLSSVLEENTESTKPIKKSFVSFLMEVATIRSPSFREDSYFISNLKPSEKKSLREMKEKLSSSTLASNSIWAVNLSDSDEKTDVVLLKFLRARDFKVSEALTMLQKCLLWRNEFNADHLLEEELEFAELEGVVAYMHASDRDGHPVCYNAYGIFKDKQMYEKIFGDEQKLQKFLRWRVQVMERGIKLLQFKPGGTNSIIQVTDLKNMPKKELRVASNHILSLFQDNYPEMVARKVFINVPWYFTVLYSMFSPFLTQRTKSKFVIAREGNVAETLYKFISPENIPVQYGGFSRPGDLQTGSQKPASEFAVKGGEKVNLEIEGIEGGWIINWEIVVGGWDLDYSVEFIPEAEGSYTVAIEKPKKIPASDQLFCNSFAAKEDGKMVISLDNSASKRRKVAAYRYFVRKTSCLV